MNPTLMNELGKIKKEADASKAKLDSVINPEVDAWFKQEERAIHISDLKKESEQLSLNPDERTSLPKYIEKIRSWMDDQNENIRSGDDLIRLARKQLGKSGALTVEKLVAKRGKGRSIEDISDLFNILEGKEGEEKSQLGVEAGEGLPSRENNTEMESSGQSETIEKTETRWELPNRKEVVINPDVDEWLSQEEQAIQLRELKKEAQLLSLTKGERERLPRLAEWMRNQMETGYLRDGSHLYNHARLKLSDSGAMTVMKIAEGKSLEKVEQLLEVLLGEK